MGREVVVDGYSPTRLPALYFRGCDLTAEWLAAKEHVRVQFLAAAPITNSEFRMTNNTGCASARGRVSKTQLTPGGTEAACHL